MYLNHIEAYLLCQHCGLSKACNDLLNLALGHPSDIGCHCIVQLFAQLIWCDFLHQHTGNVFEHRHHIGIALMQLGADLAICTVGNLYDFPIECKAFLIEQEFFKFAFPDRNIPDNKHCTAALGNTADFGKTFLVGQSECCRDKDDAIFQLYPAIIDGT